MRIYVLSVLLLVSGVLSAKSAKKQALKKEIQVEEKVPEKKSDPVSRLITAGYMIAPDVPSQITFGSDTVTLDRVDLYERLDRELIAFTFGHSTTLLILKRANRYIPQIASILKEMGVPFDFVYLCAIESYFDPRAISSAKAAGLWQFMPQTAKEYNLEINEYVDERYNVEKATRAACQYLLGAYQKYGNWLSVAASYNGGTTRITNELGRQQQASSIDLFLNEETSRYVFRILAMKQLLEDPLRYGFALRSNQLYHPIGATPLAVDTPIVNLTQFAAKHGLSYAQLLSFNPWLRDRSLPNKGRKNYLILIPTPAELYYSTRTPQVYNKRWVID